ncbi:MAG TPA: MarR family transcriptional regulator, partial [Bacillota bacterium]|nr:MarR family transcriptional regulator [Bacillota bacterium]
KEMGEILLLDSGTLTPVLKKLESKGYLSRKRSKEDERTVMISITEKGQDLKAEAAMIPERMGECIKLSKEEASKLQKILYKTLKKMEREK